MDRRKIKGDDEITHEELVQWYQSHLPNSKLAAAALEELMVRIDKYRSKTDAYAAIACMGNQVLAGKPLAQVAKAQSDGPTAEQGGLAIGPAKEASWPSNSISPCLACRSVNSVPS